jgi:hypothetical protein
VVREANSISEIEETINYLWDLYDDAQSAGDKDLADDFASRAFVLLEKLPGNVVYLSMKQ